MLGGIGRCSQLTGQIFSSNRLNIPKPSLKPARNNSPQSTCKSQIISKDITIGIVLGRESDVNSSSHGSIIVGRYNSITSPELNFKDIVATDVSMSVGDIEVWNGFWENIDILLDSLVGNIVVLVCDFDLQ